MRMLPCAVNIVLSFGHSECTRVIILKLRESTYLLSEKLKWSAASGSCVYGVLWFPPLNACFNQMSWKRNCIHTYIRNGMLCFPVQKVNKYHLFTSLRRTIHALQSIGHFCTRNTEFCVCLLRNVPHLHALKSGNMRWQDNSRLQGSATSPSIGQYQESTH